MTQRHERYLKQRPGKIALKRLKRRRAVAARTHQRKVDVRKMRDILSHYLATRPASQPIRVGSKKWHDPITKFFRKPTV